MDFLKIFDYYFCMSPLAFPLDFVCGVSHLFSFLMDKFPLILLFVSCVPILLFASDTVSIFVHTPQAPADMHVPILHHGAFV